MEMRGYVNLKLCARKRAATSGCLATKDVFAHTVWRVSKLKTCNTPRTNVSSKSSACAGVRSQVQHI